MAGLLEDRCKIAVAGGGISPLGQWAAFTCPAQIQPENSEASGLKRQAHASQSFPITAAAQTMQEDHQGMGLGDPIMQRKQLTAIGQRNDQRLALIHGQLGRMQGVAQGLQVAVAPGPAGPERLCVRARSQRFKRGAGVLARDYGQPDEHPNGADGADAKSEDQCRIRCGDSAQVAGVAPVGLMTKREEGVERVVPWPQWLDAFRWPETRDGGEFSPA